MTVLLGLRQGLDTNHKAPELLQDSVYGLAELHRAKIADASAEGNPGCYAVACILGLAPAARKKMIESGKVISDGKTVNKRRGKKAKTRLSLPGGI